MFCFCGRKGRYFCLDRGIPRFEGGRFEGGRYGRFGSSEKFHGKFLLFLPFPSTVQRYNPFNSKVLNDSPRLKRATFVYLFWWLNGCLYKNKRRIDCTMLFNRQIWIIPIRDKKVSEPLLCGVEAAIQNWCQTIKQAPKFCITEKAATRLLL